MRSMRSRVLAGAAAAAVLALHEPHARGDQAEPDTIGQVSDRAADSLQVLWEIDTGG